MEAVAAGAEEVEEVVVAEDLELLADFVADVAIGRVKARKETLKVIVFSSWTLRI